MALSKSNIAIFSVREFNSFNAMLIESKIFKAKNIIQVSKDDMAKAKGKSIFLVDWCDFHDEIEEILRLKADQTAIIIYVPQCRVENIELLNQVTQIKNVIIVNTKGRLMNDIVTSLITINYEQ